MLLDGGAFPKFPVTEWTLIVLDLQVNGLKMAVPLSPLVFQPLAHLTPLVRYTYTLVNMRLP